MERLNLNRLLKIQEIAGCEVEVCADNVTKELDTFNNEKYENVVSFIELRFGYWRPLHEEQFDQIQEILNENHLKLELWMDDWDEDCECRLGRDFSSLVLYELDEEEEKRLGVWQQDIKWSLNGCEYDYYYSLEDLKRTPVIAAPKPVSIRAPTKINQRCFKSRRILSLD